MLSVTESSIIVAEEYPKIFLYSGHDINIMSLLSSLNLAEVHVTKFTSAVIMELFSVNNIYYIKVSLLRVWVNKALCDNVSFCRVKSYRFRTTMPFS